MNRRELIASLALAALKAAPKTAFLGITVMPEDYQVEGIDQVIRNIKARAGANARATSPHVMAPSDQQHGQRPAQPAAQDELPRQQGHIGTKFLTAAKKVGLKTCSQIQSVIPPGYIVTSGG